MRTVLITGCSSGFGFQAAQVLGERGDTVYATMRDPDGKNAGPAGELRQFATDKGADIRVLDLDVMSDDSVAAAAAAVAADGRTADVVINNAGQMFVGLTEAFSGEEVARQLDVNVVGVHRVNRAFLPAMREQGSGLFINVTSIAGRIAIPFFAIYHASKWGLEGYSLGMRRELASCGIDVVVVEPGPFTTELFGQSPRPEDADGRADTYPAVVGEQFDGMNEAFNQMFDSPDVPTDPIDVVNRFVELIDMPAGSRPFRSPVGVDLGVRERNASDEAHDPAFLESMGLTEFATLKT